jgi:uncharacterized protein
MTSSIPFEAEGLRGHLHRADGAGDGMVLTHGAGGIVTRLCFWRWRLSGDGPNRIALRSAFPSAKTVGTAKTGRLSQGSRRPSGGGRCRAGNCEKESYSCWPILRGPSGEHIGGGRAELVEGLMLLSYPLHPPGKPAQLCTTHFPRPRARAMFVPGTSESFGSIEEIQAALRLIRAAHTLTVVDGAGARPKTRET